jgi:hypothetical protein
MLEEYNAKFVAPTIQAGLRAMKPAYLPPSATTPHKATAPRQPSVVRQVSLHQYPQRSIHATFT